jgi:hypothetical protein
LRARTDLTVKPGETAVLHARAFVPDQPGAEQGRPAGISARIYMEAGTFRGKEARVTALETESDESVITVTIPDDIRAGETIHIILTAKAAGEFHLTHYAQVILTAADGRKEK